MDSNELEIDCNRYVNDWYRWWWWWFKSNGTNWSLIWFTRKTWLLRQFCNDFWRKLTLLGLIGI